jgi:hypothetical protein
MKATSKLTAVSAVSAVIAVWSYMTALMNASFAFSAGDEWRQQIAHRWSFIATIFAASAVVFGVAAGRAAWRSCRSTTTDSLDDRSDHQDREFTGTYVPHWEIPHFVVTSDRMSRNGCPTFRRASLSDSSWIWEIDAELEQHIA